MTEKGLSGHKIYMEVKYNMKLSTMKNKKQNKKQIKRGNKVED